MQVEITPDELVKEGWVKTRDEISMYKETWIIYQGGALGYYTLLDARFWPPKNTTSCLRYMHELNELIKTTK